MRLTDNPTLIGHDALMVAHDLITLLQEPPIPTAVNITVNVTPDADLGELRRRLCETFGIVLPDGRPVAPRRSSREGKAAEQTEIPGSGCSHFACPGSPIPGTDRCDRHPREERAAETPIDVGTWEPSAEQIAGLPWESIWIRSALDQFRSNHTGQQAKRPITMLRAWLQKHEHAYLNTKNAVDQKGAPAA